MGVYPVTAFDGTTIVGANVDIVGTVDTNSTVVARIGVLENGTKYDADGTDDADLTYGAVSCRYRVFGAANGNASLNSGTAALEALQGKYGTLTATVDATTKTCNARCTRVITEEYTVDNDPPAGATRRMRAYVSMEWERFSNWV
jgi:hypothetical protein